MIESIEESLRDHEKEQRVGGEEQQVGGEEGRAGVSDDNDAPPADDKGPLQTEPDLPVIKPVLPVDKPVKQEMKLGPPLQSEHTVRQVAVVEAFKYAWAEYKRSSWGMDEVKPVSHTSSTWFNLGLTIIDSLDTMWLMGLETELQEARQWVEHGLDLAQNRNVNLFEVSIRVLGGLLSAYHLTRDELYLDKAVRTGDQCW